MGNNTRSILISGAVCVVVLIITIGMFVYGNATTSTYESIAKFTEQEVNSFNNKFTMYEGVQNGTTVKQLIAILVTNSTAYEDDEMFVRLPQLVVKNHKDFFELGIENATRPLEKKEKSEYIKNLTRIRNALNARKKYLIKMEYSTTGLIDKISILDEPGTI